MLPYAANDFVDERDIAAFQAALRASENDPVTSVSDWFPTPEEMVKQGTPRPQPPLNEFRASSVFLLVRWPILVLTGGWLAILSLLYLLLRVYVALAEHFLFWRGERQRLREQLRAASTYAEWVAAAKQLDHHLGLDLWREDPKLYYYDYQLVENAVEGLRTARTKGDSRALVRVLQTCIRNNFAGIENPELYSQTYYGTKKVVHEYYQEAVQALDHLAGDESIEVDTRRLLFDQFSRNYGRLALCLSGGATFAYYHFGVVKALLDSNLLPSVVLGTSGGGIVAGLVCTRNDQELLASLVPELADKITAFGEPFLTWFPRWYRTGARFDIGKSARVTLWFTKGSTTFREATNLSGRILNITTVPADPHLPAILCNPTTSPDCTLFSSVLASSAVPGILEPVVLMNKHDGELVAALSARWRDGSLRTDIPLESLNLLYNAKFTIVLQVNPHVSLWFYAPQGSVGRPVSREVRVRGTEQVLLLRGGFVLSALERLIRLESLKWLEFIKLLDLLPRLMQQDWLNVFLQPFSGTVTIWPTIRLGDWPRLLSDPSRERLGRMIRGGERKTWPKLLFIRHRHDVEEAIARGKRQVGVRD